MDTFYSAIRIITSRVLNVMFTTPRKLRYVCMRLSFSSRDIITR